MRLTYDKILRMAQAGSKDYKKTSDHYAMKPLLHDPYHRGEYITVPRIAPPRSVLEPVVKNLEAKLGVSSDENGRLALKCIDVVMQEIIRQDPGSGDMPPLPFFLGGGRELPLVISLDATGFGMQQFNTIAVRNPYLSRSAQQRDGPVQVLQLRCGRRDRHREASHLVCLRRSGAAAHRAPRRI